MILKVFSGQQLEPQMYEQIHDIIKQSSCPHESLINTFGDQYKTIVELDDTIHVYFDGGQSPVPYCYETSI